MAQIITHGTNQRTDNWPVGVAAQCPACGCQFVITNGDLGLGDSVFVPPSRLMPARFSMACPERAICRQRIALSNEQSFGPIAPGGTGQTGANVDGVTEWASDRDYSSNGQEDR